MLLGAEGRGGETPLLHQLFDKGLDFERTPFNGLELRPVFGVYSGTEEKELGIPQDHRQGIVDLRDDMSERISVIPALFVSHSYSRVTPSGVPGMSQGRC